MLLLIPTRQALNASDDAGDARLQAHPCRRRRTAVPGVEPPVHLLAGTLTGTGEAGFEPVARATRSVLTIAGRSDIPGG